MCRYQRNYTLHEHILKGCIALLVLGTALQLSADQEEPWLTDPEALAEIVAQDDLLRTFHDEEFEQVAHPREMPDTMYASTPTPTPIANSLTCPVPTAQGDRRVVAHSARRSSLRSIGSVRSGSSPEFSEDRGIVDGSSPTMESNGILRS